MGGAKAPKGKGKSPGASPNKAKSKAKKHATPLAEPDAEGKVFLSLVSLPPKRDEAGQCIDLSLPLPLPPDADHLLHKTSFDSSASETSAASGLSGSTGAVATGSTVVSRPKKRVGSSPHPRRRPPTSRWRASRRPRRCSR